MISRAAFAEKSLKQIKAKSELTFGKDTSHQQLKFSYLLSVSVLKSRKRDKFLDV